MGKRIYFQTLGVLLCLSSMGVQAQGARVRHWAFDEEQEGKPPSGFLFTRTGGGRPGQWVIKAVADAPSSAHVLAQVDSDSTDFRFPMAVADEPLLADLRLAVKCKPVSGEVDQASGAVFRNSATSC